MLTDKVKTELRVTAKIIRLAFREHKRYLKQHSRYTMMKDKIMDSGESFDLTLYRKYQRLADESMSAATALLKLVSKIH